MATRMEVAAALSRVLVRVTSGDPSGDVAQDLAGIQAMLSGDVARLAPVAGEGSTGSSLALSSAPPSGPTTADQVREVFAYWANVMGKGNRTRLTKERGAKIRVRLNTFTVSDLKRAIDGCASSDHHMAGGFNDIELICRNDTKTEQFIERAGEDVDAGQQGSVVENEQVAALKRQLKSAQERGDGNEYKRINAELRHAMRSAGA